MKKLVLVTFLIAISVSCSKGGGGGSSAPASPTDLSNDSRIVEQLNTLTPANLGFYLPTHTDFRSLAQVKNSILKIYAPAGEKRGVADGARSLNVELNYTAYLGRVNQGIGALRGEERAQALLVVAQISSCMRRSIPFESCQVYSGHSKGTAFVTTAAGNRLWTALHVVEEILREQVSSVNREQLDQLEIPFVLVNDAGSVVFENLNQQARVETMDLSYFTLGTLTRANGCEQHPRDWIQISLPARVAPGLVINAAIPSEEERLYIGGYPIRTEDRRSIGATGVPVSMDSDGTRFYFTRGQLRRGVRPILQMDACFRNLGDRIQSILATDADGVQGMSGGPLLNSRGQVVGIYNHGFPEDGRANNAFITYSTSFQSIFSFQAQ